MKEKYKSNALLPLFFTIITIMGSIIFIVHTLQENALNQEKRIAVSRFDSLFKNELNREAEVLTGYLNILKKDKNLQNLFKRRGREKLYKAVEPIFNDLNKRINLTHLYFIENDGKILLRAHDLKRHSDIVPRYTFVKAKELNQSFSGIEFGIKKNYTLRVVHPWIIEGKTIGYIEMGKEADKLIADISSLLNTEIYLAVNKNIYKDAPEFVKQRIKPAYQLDGFYIVYNTFEIPPAINEILHNLNDKNINFDYLDRYFHAFSSPLIDVSEKNLGQIIFLVDSTQEHKIIHSLLNTLILFSLVMVGIIFVLGYFFITKKEKEINLLANELKNHNDFLQTLIETTPVPIFYKDEKNIYINANKKFLDMLGYESIEQIKGKSIYELMPKEAKDIYCKNDMEVFEHPEHIHTYECAIDVKNNKRQHVVFYKSAFFKYDESVGGLVGIIYDITERKQMEERLKKFNELLCERVEYEVAQKMKALKDAQKKEDLLLQQSKMAAMGEMIGAIAHQWKQPLNIIGLYAQNLKLAYDFGEIGQEEIELAEKNIMDQVLFMSETIDDFRDFFKPAKDKISFIVYDAVQKVYDLIKNGFEKREIEVVFHQHEHFMVFGYPNEFKHVILNILNNAKDVFEEKNIKGRIDIYFENDGQSCIVLICDNGGGIPKEMLPDKIFESYVSTKESRGTGIGLQIAKTIIEDHMNGKISARNIEDTQGASIGAEFEIRLPLHKKIS